MEKATKTMQETLPDRVAYGCSHEYLIGMQELVTKRRVIIYLVKKWFYDTSHWKKKTVIYLFKSHKGKWVGNLRR